jgi:hypothetical protein
MATATQRLRNWAINYGGKVHYYQVGDGRWEISAKREDMFEFSLEAGPHPTVDAAASDLLAKLKEVGEEVPEA